MGLLNLFGRRGERAGVKHVEDTPRSKIETAPQGMIEVEGFAWPGEDTEPNLRGEECVYRRLVLQREDTERNSEGKTRKVWRTVGVHCFPGPFYIADETGMALVEVAGGDVNLHEERQKGWRSLSTAQRDAVITVMPGTISGFPPSNFLLGLFAKKFRVQEMEIQAGSPLYVRGVFTTKSQDLKVKSQGLTAFRRRVFDEAGRTRRNLNVFVDTNRDGKVSEKESRSFFTSAAKVERQRAGAEEKEFPVFGVLKSDENHRLLVADTHETHLLSRMRWRRWKPAVVVLMFLFGGWHYLSPVWVLVGRNARLQNAPPPEPAPIVTPKRDVASMHADCVAGAAQACERLLGAKIPEANAEYYRQRACQLGLKQHCK